MVDKNFDQDPKWDIENKNMTAKADKDFLEKLWNFKNVIFYSADTLEGHSGSPCLVVLKDGYHVAGLHTGGLDWCKDDQFSNITVNHAQKIPLDEMRRLVADVDEVV